MRAGREESSGASSSRGRRAHDVVPVSHPGDRHEVEARAHAAMASAALGATSCATCATGNPCATCGRAKVGRAGLVPAGGAPLSSGVRAQAERQLGPLADVRVHTGSDAARAARRLDARAYTLGNSIVFGDGAFAPQSPGGFGLLVHELRHTQQDPGGAMVHREGPALECMDPTVAATLSDDEIASRTADLRRALADAPADSEDAAWIEDELRMFQTIQFERMTDLEVVANDIPRPPGLPEDGSWALEPADLPADMVASLPEGRIVQIALPDPDAPPPMSFGPVDPMASFGPVDPMTSFDAVDPLASFGPVDPMLGGMEPAMGGIEPLAPIMVATADEEDDALPLTLAGGPTSGAAWSMLTSVDAELMATGFRAAGPDAVGIVGMPRLFSPGARVPNNLMHLLDAWGHTAVYVRRGGVITIVRGFNPTMEGLMGGWSSVRSGASAVPGQITADAYLFTMTGARSLEYPVTPTLAEALAQGLPEPGLVRPGSGLPTHFTAGPARHGIPCQSNCVLYAVETAEGALGGRIGPASTGTPVTAMGEGGAVVPRTASQGRLIRFMSAVEEGTEAAMAVPAATGEGVAGSMSTGLRVLKWGGRAMLVIGIITVPLEIWLAPPGRRARTAVGAIAGFAGGFAAGAAAGLVCGPGAPVCSVVLGLAFGIAGALGARASAEAIYDAIALLWEHPEYIPLGLFGPAHTLTAAGGYGRMLRSPLDVQRESEAAMRARRLAELRARLVAP